MSGDDTELAHHIAQLRGVEVLFKDACSSVCDGCGICPLGENGQLSICRDPTGGYRGTLYLCSDCIAESWARAPSQRDRRSTAEMKADEEERERKVIGEVAADLIRTNPDVQAAIGGVMRQIMGRATYKADGEAEALIGEGV